jgi:hypothetical protein
MEEGFGRQSRKKEDRKKVGRHSENMNPPHD